MLVLNLGVQKTLGFIPQELLKKYKKNKLKRIDGLGV